MAANSTNSASNNDTPLLCVQNIEISRQEAGKWRPVIQNVSLELHAGEMAALVGPSGCGKSMTAHALVGLLETGLRMTDGHIFYKGEDISRYDERRLQQLRREEIALLIQHSLSGLDPIRTVRRQMVETLKLQARRSRKETESYLCTLLDQMGFADPEVILDAYPFELSGGMRQRVLLAMMLSTEPTLFIADEPTTALDALNRDRVLALLKQLQADFGLTVLLISHDEQSVRKFADRVITMQPSGMAPVQAKGSVI
ncbi:ABC-type dipeptide/oligopeptide/nickel transport system, ATPase component [Paenibacillus algorifonticola]|uniref:ABC-type dipeptide/oligopeptide/nickel transport system, ATPase component n=1 Tax=Paenibacillus algorifonticola TaxID=684063 RepID=A0A1I2AZL6_9BACL|nr:ABC transporter ATP-binding protein [Paenibacillus algorifonticola]SFE49078.1 ABC-type dipeptide/oligopeptide/nickel transport system, ATPase component [Paenibacillus algorifonticola]